MTKWVGMFVVGSAEAYLAVSGDRPLLNVNNKDPYS